MPTHQTVIPLGELEDLMEARIRAQVPGIEVLPFTSLNPEDYKMLNHEAICLLVFGGESDNPRGGRSYVRTLEWGVLVGARNLRGSQAKGHRGAYDFLEQVRNALAGWHCSSPNGGFPVMFQPVRNGFLTQTQQGVFFYSQVVRAVDVYART